MNTLKAILLAGFAGCCLAGAGQAQEPADLDDLEIAHVAYVADNIDIRYAHLALAISDNPDIRTFAETMIRDHMAVNEQALALLAKLGAEAKDNFLSQSLLENADKLVARLRDAGLQTPDPDLVDIKGRRFYRVRVGPVVERSEAEAMLDRVSEIAGTKAQVQQYP